MKTKSKIGHKKWYIIFCMLLTFVFSCSKVLFDHSESEINDCSSVCNDSYHTRSSVIDIFLLDLLRQDTLFNELVELADYKVGMRIIDSLRLISRNTNEFDSLLSQIVSRRSEITMAKYEKVKSRYPENLINYIAYEYNINKNKAITDNIRKTRSIYSKEDSMKIGVDDVIVQGERVANYYRGVSSMIIYSSTLAYHRYMQETHHQESNCSCIRRLYEVCMPLYECFTQSSYLMFMIRDCAIMSCNFTEEITPFTVYYAQKNGMIEKKGANEIEPYLACFLDEIRWSIEYPLFKEIFIYDMSCRAFVPDSGGGAGGGTTHPPTPPDPEEPCPHEKCEVCNKYIRTMTRSIACNNDHIFCPTNGNCEIEAQLSIPSGVTLGKSYDVNLTISSPNVQVASIQYKIWRDGTIGQEFILPHSNVRSFQNRATVPGTWNINATVTYGENKTKVVTAQIKHNFPTADMIVTNPSVIAAMNDAWATTKSLATATNWAEVGFVIYLKTTPNGFEYDCSAIVTNTVDYATRPSVTLTDYKDNPPVSVSNPLEGGKFYVADFHTHPPLCLMPAPQGFCSERPVGPSKSEPDDPRFDAPGPMGIPSFVCDYIGDKKGKHYSTDAINSSSKIYQYGGTQRNNNY